MPVTGWKAPGTAASVDRDGKSLWTNPNNAKTDDSNFAECGVGKNTYSDWLRLTNFDFSEIPAGSTIDGIEVYFYRVQLPPPVNDITDDVIKLRDASGQVGDNKATATWWASTKQTAIYGSYVDTWNAGLLDSDVKAATFGVDLSARNHDVIITRYAQIYFCKIRIYYTALPTVETDPCSDIGSTSFDANGDITSTGGDIISTRGFHYSKVFDGFEWGIDTDPLDDSGGAITWTIVAGGSNKVEIDTAQHYTGTRSARFYRAGADTVRAGVLQSAISSDQVIDFWFRRTSGIAAFFFHGNGSWRIWTYIDGVGSVKYYDGSYHDTGADIAVGSWHRLSFNNVDWSGHTYDIYLDGVLIQSSAGMYGDSAVANEIVWYSNSGTGEFWIDEVGVWDIEDESDSFGEGEYSLEITGLDSATDYWVQAFAKNAAGFGYGAIVTCRTIIAKVLSDTVAISDALVKSVSITKADTVAIADAIAKVISLVKGDAVIISDAIVKSVGLVKTDAMAIADSLTKLMGLIKADTVTIADTVAKLVNLAKADTVIIADSISKAISLVKADTVTITDSIRKRISIVKADTMAIADTITHIGLGKFINLFDTVTITDSLVGVLRIKSYVKQAIDRIEVKGLDTARMSIKQMGIAQMSIKRMDIAQIQAKGMDIARMQTKRIGAAKTALFRWIIRRWTA